MAAERNKQKVFVTRRIPKNGPEMLRSKFDVEIYNGYEAISRPELLHKVAAVQGLLCLLSEQVDRELLDRAPYLKVVSNYAVGYDNIDVNAATERDIVVTNTPGVLTDATADLTWALILAASRRLIEADRTMRVGNFTGWSPLFMLGQDLKGKILGILGAGRIGVAVAERSLGWRMKIMYSDHQENEYLNSELSARRVDLDELITAADIISIHLPLTKDTHHLIGEMQLKKMKKTAVLVNTARGPIIDEKALLQALQQGWLAAAGLDVYENEPLLTPGLERLDNVILAPHIGSATFRSREEMSRIAAQNLLDVLEGRKPQFVVNKEIYRRR